MVHNNISPAFGAPGSWMSDSAQPVSAMRSSLALVREGTRISSEAPLRIQALGALTIRRGDRVEILTSTMRSKLLVALLVNAGTYVWTDKLITELWDGQPPHRPDWALQSGVMRLKKFLRGWGEQITIEHGPSGAYRLDLGDTDFDVAEFRQLTQRALHLLGTGSPDGIGVGRSALALWTDTDAFINVQLGALGSTERTHLEQQRSLLTERVLEAELRAGRHRELIPELSMLVDRHRDREYFHQLYMTALYSAGRQAEALEVYWCLRDRLRALYGVEPTPPLRETYLAILRQDTALSRDETD